MLQQRVYLNKRKKVRTISQVQQSQAQATYIVANVRTNITLGPHLQTIQQEMLPKPT